MDVRKLYTVRTRRPTRPSPHTSVRTPSGQNSNNVLFITDVFSWNPVQTVNLTPMGGRNLRETQHREMACAHGQARASWRGLLIQKLFRPSAEASQRAAALDTRKLPRVTSGSAASPYTMLNVNTLELAASFPDTL